MKPAMGAWSATAMATTKMAPILTTAPMAYGMLDAVMLMVGDDAEMVDVSGAFMEADGDDVTYTAMSDDDMVATAMADGSMVSIMAVGAGSATVTVTATDKDGSDTQDISVTVNAAPVASYAITAVPSRIKAGMTGTITITAQDANGNATAGGTVTVSLSGDDDMVTAIGLANNDQLELGSDGEGSFRIFAKADATSGSVTITVIGEPGVATVSDMVRIGPNQNPMAGDDIADQMVLVGEMATVESTLSDHEGDDLTYTVSSSDDMIATATNDGAMITITGVAAGDATITVTGMDTEMGSGMQTIMVTVKEPNTAPMAGDDVEDQMVYVGAMVEVQSNFSDPDEDMLSYTATSDMMDVRHRHGGRHGHGNHHRRRGRHGHHHGDRQRPWAPWRTVRHADHHGLRHDDAAHGVGRSVHHQRDERRRRHGHGHADALATMPPSIGPGQRLPTAVRGCGTATRPWPATPPWSPSLA